LDANAWSFGEIKTVDPARAKRLEAAAGSQQLVSTLASALRSVGPNDRRVGFDGIGNDLTEPRVTVQVRVPADLYDWFYNARSGYRAQFWLSPEDGLRFNEHVVAAMVNELRPFIPESLIGRRLRLVQSDGHREEFDEGPMELGRETVLASLSGVHSKIWICERLIPRELGPSRQLDLGVLGPRLIVPGWTEDGLRAPLPASDSAWVDIKGGFVTKSGEVVQPKSPERRAKAIHETGWT
jgi:hypothetical protein